MSTDAFREHHGVRVLIEKEACGLRYTVVVGRQRIAGLTGQQAEAVCDAVAHAQNRALQSVQRATRVALGLE